MFKTPSSKHANSTEGSSPLASSTGMGTQWKGMGLSLMRLDLFRESILRSDEALKETGLKVSDLLLNADENTFNETVNAFVGLAAIQVRMKDAVSYAGLTRMNNMMVELS